VIQSSCSMGQRFGAAPLLCLWGEIGKVDLPRGWGIYVMALVCSLGCGLVINLTGRPTNCSRLIRAVDPRTAKLSRVSCEVCLTSGWNLTLVQIKSTPTLNQIAKNNVNPRRNARSSTRLSNAYANRLPKPNVSCFF